MSGRAVRDPALLEVRKLRGFRDGNARRTQFVADPTLGRHILQGVTYRWELARWIHDCFQLGVRRWHTALFPASPPADGDLVPPLAGARYENAA